ncbi:MAG: hypothetical protein CAK88_06185 [Verrucomicrobiia bacterium AMD-G2]|nr:MAG: hypothetical protein CAK88_06185 [Verrucomicrobiae bacterium AMD-G2]
MPSFVNPAGLWALLGIPAVLLIHFLQRKAQSFPVSTLFLLEKTHREANIGRKFDRLTNSIPLWMQLLAVLLITWLMTEPRFPMERSTQRIAIVLDSSASMSVSKEFIITSLAEQLPPLKGFASDVEYTVLESIPGKPRIYAGKSTEDLLAALKAWQPLAPLTDPTLALRLARSLVSRDGIVLFVTDTPVEGMPFDARLLAAGKKIGNCGFTGVAFDEKDGTLVWRATLQNYADEEITRTWQIDSGNGQLSPPRSITLEPRSLLTLQANFPSKSERIKLILSADDFPLDDTLHLVRPNPKQLFLSTAAPLEALSKKILRSIENMQPVGTQAADLSLISYDPLDPVLAEGNAVIFSNDATQGGQYLAGGLIATQHPLMNGINWQSLLIRETISLEIRANDEVLLRQAERPLILLRNAPATAIQAASQQLLFNFDPRLSNIDTQPALIVCLLRFAEQIRSKKIAKSQENWECGQPINIAIKPSTAALFLDRLDAQGKTLASQSIAPNQPLFAPAEPGFYQVRQGEEILVTSAAYFADTREADFSLCASENQLTDAQTNTVQAHSSGDPFYHYWIILLLLLLIASWIFIKERKAVVA